MRIALASLALLAAFAVPAAHADTLYFTFTGDGQKLSFTLPSTIATPTDVYGDHFGQTVTYTGTSSGTSEFFFDNYGDFMTNFGFDATATHAPLYSGSPSNPTFLTGMYTFTGGQTLQISSVATTPEPSSFFLLGTGALGVLGVARRKFRTAA